MEAVLKYTGRRRPILPLPFAVGKLQGAVLEQLPVNLFTVTRAQVGPPISGRLLTLTNYYQVELLKSDNIVSQNPGPKCISMRSVFNKHDPGAHLRSIHEILPTYL